MATGPKGNFTIFNIPRKSSVHGVVLPEHGAEIGISVKEFHEPVVDEWIREDLNVTSLKYLTIDEVIDAIGLPEKELCLYCWRGC